MIIRHINRSQADPRFRVVNDKPRNRNRTKSHQKRVQSHLGVEQLERELTKQQVQQDISHGMT